MCRQILRLHGNACVSSNQTKKRAKATRWSSGYPLFAAAEEPAPVFRESGYLKRNQTFINRGIQPNFLATEFL